ncbi:60S ribosomal protein L10a [Camellia lanceoleosa]|uniref:60S ribosomal protein L10a n=1 Tax=Camellia lanceoleosa TaxID=1840588 RepID=A0ACC0GG71_9ERIC|nr:60S ribosomal protein L10a [Camellia lanceoleosa]
MCVKDAIDLLQGHYIVSITQDFAATSQKGGLQAIVVRKFPTPVTHQEPVESKVNETKATVKFQLKKVICMGVAVFKMCN